MARDTDDLPLRTAAGFVLVRRKAGRWLYLALMNRKRAEPGLPKGHSEPGETELETALRETAEETGIVDVDVRRSFRRDLDYLVRRRGRDWHKRVTLFVAVTRTAKVQLSDEHVSYEWLPLDAMLREMPWQDLDDAVRDAALFLKDPALFALAPATEKDAYAHLKSLPHADRGLRDHLRGGARLARRFAEALAAYERRIDVEATAAGTVLHDVGRALGEHEDHQRAGVRHLRTTPLAPYGFACISHFTKGAPPKALRTAGLSRKLVESFEGFVDMRTLTWEERCAALADACMKGDQPVRPAVRFEDLRARYGASPLIDLQERRTEKIRAKIESVIGVDPLALVSLT